MKNKHGNAYLLVCLLLLFSVHSLAQTETAPVDTSDVIDFIVFPKADPFTADNPLEINLSFDVRHFTRKKFEDEYQKATLSYKDRNNAVVEKEIRLKARGNTRKEICSFPPIKLNLKKSGFDKKQINNIEKLKLVTHCKKSKTYEQYILKEFLIYRMYNLLTDYSYRVRLYKINYIDTEDRVKTYTSYGFLIESHDHLADRINAGRYELPNLPTKMTDYDEARLMFLFQYMIGNTDWSVPAMHNIRLYKVLDAEREYPVAIPYDFDYSGMVNAYYAVPDEQLGIESVRERIYRGYCIPAEDYTEYFELFNKKKDELYALVEKFQFLNKRHKNEMIKYLDEFYRIINSEYQRDRYIIKSCRNI